MSSKIAYCGFQNGRLIISCAKGGGDTLGNLEVDGVVRAGSWNATPVGYLFVLDADSQNGVPGLAAGPHTVKVHYATSTATANVVYPGGTKDRYSGKLGLQQQQYSVKTELDVISSLSQHHAKLLRVEAQIPHPTIGWNYGAFDQIFTAAKNVSGGPIEIMLLLTYTPKTYFPTFNGTSTVVSWGNSTTGTIASYPRDATLQDQWVANAMQLVNYLYSRYPTVYVANEWCNEPNAWEFGAAKGKYPVSVSAYQSLLKKAYTAATAAAPNLINIAGGSAPCPTDSVQLGPNDWYTRLKQGGAKPGEHFDHIGVHLYDGVNAPWSQKWTTIAPLWPNVQLWATEQGTNDNNWYVNGQGTGAKGVGAQIDAFRAKGSQAGAWFEFTLFDRTSAADGYNGYGLKTYNGTNKTWFNEFASRAT